MAKDSRKVLVVLEVHDSITDEDIHEALCLMFHEGQAIHEVSHFNGGPIKSTDVPDWVENVAAVTTVNID